MVESFINLPNKASLHFHPQEGVGGYDTTIWMGRLDNYGRV